MKFLIFLSIVWGALILAGLRAHRRVRKEDGCDRALSKSRAHRAACEKSINEYWGDE